MADTFDPYRKWLRINPQDELPDHYRLLGLNLFEEDTAVIERAAVRAVGRVQEHLTGEHAEVALRLLNEIAAAKACLLGSNEKAAYDAQLQESLATPAVADSSAAQYLAKQAAARAECDRFLTVLRAKDLISIPMVENLRRQIGQSKKIITAVVIAERLIKAGHLTLPLAKRLLASIDPTESRLAAQPDSDGE
ncbi:MAG TPA: hypothetical protein VE890_00885, partial [Thermoguttaceae bacterium]|nr:hypothetical protein [Thermoguttaceae bacterium]